MEKRERIKSILGICLLYIIVTSIFFFINKACSIIIFQGAPDFKIHSFLQGNALWIVAVATIIVVLTLYLKKLNQGTYFSLLGNSFVRVTAGALAMFDGIIHLASTIPLYVTSIQSSIQSSQMVQQNMQRALTGVIITDVISVFLLLCQVFAGIFLIRFHHKSA